MTNLETLNYSPVKPRSSKGINDFDVIDHLIYCQENHDGKFYTSDATVASPKVQLYGSGGPYQEDFDLEDPYCRIVSPSTRQSRKSGGSHFPRLSRSKDEHDHAEASGQKYYYKRAGTGHELQNCGHVLRVSACLDQFCQSQSVLPIVSRCHRYECPECYHDTVKRAASTAAKTLYQFSKDLYNQYGLKAGRPKHVVISPNPKNWSKSRVLEDGASSMDQMAKKVLTWAAKDDFLAMKGWRHFEREKHKDGTDCPGKDCKLPTSAHKWAWGPHYHFVGYGYFKSNREIQKRFPGWTLTVIEEAAGKHRDIYATLLYQGSHASVIYRESDGRQARKMLLSVGFVNPRIYCRKLDRMEVQVLQCKCGKDKHVFEAGIYQGTIDRNHDLGPHLRYKKFYTYHFNERWMTAWLRGGPDRLRKRLKELRRRFSESSPNKYPRSGILGEGGILMKSGCGPP